MKAIRETAKTTAMIPSSHSHDASQAMHKWKRMIRD
jgi:hypothetical protein